MRGQKLTLWLLLPFVPIVALGARLFGHASHFQDGEGQIPPTIGREIALVGWQDVFQYQLIPYQGSLLVDSSLSAVGYGVFGDHLLAWHSVGIFYGVVITVCGFLVLKKCCGNAGALAFPVLIAGMPFVIKDGLLGVIGGHAGGVAYGLAALACAVWADATTRRRWLPLLAGLFWAFGVWYVRTTYVVFPALVLALVPTWRSGLPRLLLGGCLLPLLLWFNAQALVSEVPRFMGNDVQEFALGLATDIGRSKDEDLETIVRPVGHFAEASGWALRRVLYEQPAPVREKKARALPGTHALGVGWVIAWVVSIPAALLGWLWAWRRKNQGGTGGDGSLAGTAPLAVVLFCASYVLAYVASDSRVEVEALEMALALALLTAARSFFVPRPMARAVTLSTI